MDPRDVVDAAAADPLGLGQAIRDIFHGMWGVGIAVVGYFVHKLDKRIDAQDEKIEKHDVELFDPDGALRKGDHQVRNDVSGIVLGMTNEVRGLRDDVADLRVDLAIATGGKIAPTRKK